MRNPMIVKVQIARKELALHEDDYRALLHRITGKSSSAACTDFELEAILTEMKRLGWKPKVNGAKVNGAKVNGAKTNSAVAKVKSEKRHVRLVFAIWGELGRAGALDNPSRQALLAFVNRQTGVSHPDWLTAKQANVVTEALKAMLKRHKAKSNKTGDAA